MTIDVVRDRDGGWWIQSWATIQTRFELPEVELLSAVDVLRFFQEERRALWVELGRQLVLQHPQRPGDCTCSHGADEHGPDGFCRTRQVGACGCLGYLAAPPGWWPGLVEHRVRLATMTRDEYEAYCREAERTAQAMGLP